MYLRRSAAVIVLAAAVAAGSASASSAQTLKLGSILYVTGQTGQPAGAKNHSTGRVVVRAQWNGGKWHVVSIALTDHNGNYRFQIKPRMRGQLVLRVVTPDKQEQRLVVRVV